MPAAESKPPSATLGCAASCCTKEPSIAAMAAPFVRDQWSLGILVDVSVAQHFLARKPSRHSRREPTASLGGCAVVCLGCSWCLLGAVWCCLVLLGGHAGQELVSAGRQSCSGIAAWRRPMRDWGNNADSSVLALRPLAPWKAWKSWFPGRQSCLASPTRQFQLQHHETVAHNRNRRRPRARLAGATTRGGLESQPARGFIFAN